MIFFSYSIFNNKEILHLNSLDFKIIIIFKTLADYNNISSRQSSKSKKLPCLRIGQCFENQPCDMILPHTGNITCFGSQKNARESQCFFSFCLRSKGQRQKPFRSHDIVICCEILQKFQSCVNIFGIQSDHSHIFMNESRNRFFTAILINGGFFNTSFKFKLRFICQYRKVLFFFFYPAIFRINTFVSEQYSEQYQSNLTLFRIFCGIIPHLCLILY